jgi:Rne/Rng family ribonuclease
VTDDTTPAAPTDTPEDRPATRRRSRARAAEPTATPDAGAATDGDAATDGEAPKPKRTRARAKATPKATATADAGTEPAAPSEDDDTPAPARRTRRAAAKPRATTRKKAPAGEQGTLAVDADGAAEPAAAAPDDAAEQGGEGAAPATDDAAALDVADAASPEVGEGEEASDATAVDVPAAAESATADGDGAEESATADGDGAAESATADGDGAAESATADGDAAAGTTDDPGAAEATAGAEHAEGDAPSGTRRTRSRRSSAARRRTRAATEDGVEPSSAADAADAAQEGTAPAEANAGDGDAQDGASTEGDSDDGAETDEDGAVIRRRRRRRGGRRGRGRGRSGAESTDAEGEDADADAADADSAVDRATSTDDAGGREDEGGPRADGARKGGGRGDGGRGDGGRRDGAERGSQKADADAESGDGDGDGSPSGREQGSGSTRLQARNRGRGRSSGRGRQKGGGRKPIGGVSEETRRAITEGPPRRMLVNLGEERTQVAVLEERTLVEHYVTRKEDVSYVGNIYLGRVQNVLPGMEAAFVDIGKGRNGVLYAGEVNYDEADLEGDLPRIEDHLKPGQTVLVQVTKDPMGTKGARLTQHLSIAGRYCVLAPGDGMLGISRKLTDEERERLRKILKSIRPEGFGLIVRTAAEGATQEQLESDVARLTRLWDQVQTRAAEVKPLDAVYEEPHLVMRVIRDVFGSEFSDLVVDSAELAEQIRDYLADVSPEMVDKVTVHSGEEMIFDAYEVTTQVRRALEKKVWLKSGGYLIIEKTEAMWVIDVNTGKFVGKDNLEETVLKNNLEAADEIARQLRLRDMGGIIVIDFVDMLVPANRNEVLKRFKRELARDKTKSRVMDISKLGLVQMTRKNVSQGLTETFTTTCDTCEGRGARILDHAFH